MIVWGLLCVAAATLAPSLTLPVCSNRTYLENCFQEQPPGIPSSREAVAAACGAFHGGMQCVDVYTDTCLNGDDRDIINRHVEGARLAFGRLCGEQRFREEYLRHAACYPDVSDDWQLCADQLRQANAGTVWGACCARATFLHCTRQAVARHCDDAAAHVLMTMAEVLADPHPHVYNAADTCPRLMDAEQLCTAAAASSLTSVCVHLIVGAAVSLCL